MIIIIFVFFFFSSRRRHTRLVSDWSSDVCSSDLRRSVLDDNGSHMLQERAFEDRGGGDRRQQVGIALLDDGCDFLGTFQESLKLLGGGRSQSDLGPGSIRDADRAAKYRRAARFDQHQLERFVPKHRSLSVDKALITRITPLLGRRATIALRQIVPKGAVKRQELNDEGVLDHGEELQLLEDLLPIQRLGRHDRSPADILTPSPLTNASALILLCALLGRKRAKGELRGSVSSTISRSLGTSGATAL